MVHAIADTHTVIWYLFANPRLSSPARAVIEAAASRGEHIGFSSITFTEIVYLTEKGRIDPTTMRRLLSEIDRLDGVLIEVPFNRRVAESMPTIDRQQVPDMPDRIVAATAHAMSVPVISRDRKIRLSTIPTIW
jgi:PIN domain nuclease of toxin-antitoxin system